MSQILGWQIFCYVLKLAEGRGVRLAYVVVSVQHKHTLYLQKKRFFSFFWGKTIFFSVCMNCFLLLGTTSKENHFKEVIEKHSLLSLPDSFSKAAPCLSGEQFCRVSYLSNRTVLRKHISQESVSYSLLVYPVPFCLFSVRREENQCKMCSWIV